VSQLRRQWTAYWHRNGDGRIVGSMTVMDVAMKMAMDGLSATQWQWTGEGD
jgi:hypothetical protein